MAGGGLEPVFPAAVDLLQGRNLYRPDAIDVDLYRFEVQLGDEDRLGELTAETFAERLPDSSSLDTTLTLFQETRATAETDFGLQQGLNVRFTAIAEGKGGNDIEARFVRSSSATAITIFQARGDDGNFIDSGFVVQIPRTGTFTIGDILSAIDNSPISNSLVTVDLVGGAASATIDGDFNVQTVTLGGGTITPLVRNDDYFSEDSRITAMLSEGVYYLGVAASGNDSYDPTLAGSAIGGRSEGAYELNLKFEPAVDEVDVIRDRDAVRDGVPGTAIDGDADGAPGGEFNFWFQTRSLNRRIDVTTGGEFLTPGDTLTITDFGGQSRTYELVRSGNSAQPGNVPIAIDNGVIDLPAASVAGNILSAFNAEQRVPGQVQITRDGTTLEFIGVADIELSPGFDDIAVFGRTIFVDKLGSVDADGSLQRPFNNIANPAVPNAIDSATSGDIIRIVGNGGNDNDITTESDNLPYLIGTPPQGGGVLEDGRNIAVPQGVTLMIDSGAILKFRNSRIGVGSTVVTQDRSESVLQVLGTPRVVQLSSTVDGTGNLFIPTTADVVTTTGRRWADVGNVPPRQRHPDIDQ